jgi:hypothetical protein
MWNCQFFGTIARFRVQGLGPSAKKAQRVGVSRMDGTCDAMYYFRYSCRTLLHGARSHMGTETLGIETMGIEALGLEAC